MGVFEEVRSAVAVLERAVADLEPGTLDASGAKTLMDLFTRCERLAVAGRGLAARRVESGWRGSVRGIARRRTGSQRPRA